MLQENNRNELPLFCLFEDEKKRNSNLFYLESIFESLLHHFIS